MSVNLLHHAPGLDCKRVRVCHERLVKRQITVVKTIRQHGHRVRVKRHRIVRVPVEPHTIHKGIRRVPFGRATRLGGQLLTAGGQALAGQTITVLGAPRNGVLRFRPVATAVTDQDGVWHALIPAGPGRVLEASYAGGPTLEPTISDQIRTIVHARVNLNRIHPTAVPWRGRITLTGRLPGGHLPHRGINARLEYGIGHHSTTYAVRQHVGAGRRDRFRAHFTFGAGPTFRRERVFFRVCTLPSPKYPFASGCSRKRMVTVGGHPPHVGRRHHHRHDHGARRQLRRRSSSGITA